MVSYIFPANPLGGHSWTVDDHFSLECATVAGFNPVALLDSYSLGDRIPRLKLPDDFDNSVVYRGWMLTEAEYRRLQAVVESRGFAMATSAEHYMRAHSIRGWIDSFEGLTAPTVLIPASAGRADILAAAASIPSDHGFFLKGESKSEQGLSYAADGEALFDLIREFLDYSATSEDGTLALRSFLPLDRRVAEIRSWWIGGEVVVHPLHPNFEGGELINPLRLSSELRPGLEAFLKKLQPGIRSLENRFLTADIALTDAGDWTLIEIGDGQVSGLSRSYEAEDYRYLYRIFSEEIEDSFRPEDERLVNLMRRSS